MTIKTKDGLTLDLPDNAEVRIEGDRITVKPQQQQPQYVFWPAPVQVPIPNPGPVWQVPPSYPHGTTCGEVDGISGNVVNMDLDSTSLTPTSGPTFTVEIPDGTYSFSLQ